MELAIEHLHLQFFGHDECLHDVNLHCGDGLSVVYGEVGSGKTALLKCVAAINSYEGAVTLDGAPLGVGKDGDCCMVFDDLALFGRRTLYYNLTYPLRLRKVPKAQWADMLAPLLKRWGLQKTFLDNPVYRAPKDTQVRLALARACLLPRKVLLLDNPLSGLTPDDRRQLFRTLSQWMHGYAGVVLYATDDMDEVRALGAPTAVLSGGYLLAYDVPDTLRRTLPSVYLASRMIPYWQAAEGVAQAGTVHTEWGDWAAAYPPSYEGKRVLTGFGPRDWEVQDDEEGPYLVQNTLYAEGETYSVATTQETSIVVEGVRAIGARLRATPRGQLPVYDAVGEWRIDAPKGE